MIKIETDIGNPIKCKTLCFSGGERHVVVSTKTELESAGIPLPNSLVVRANIWSSDDLMDFMLICQALRIEYAVPIDLEIPYFPYARQDRVCAPGQAFSLQLMTDLIRMTKFRKIAVWDAHSHETVTRLWAMNITPEIMFRSVYASRRRSVILDLMVNADLMKVVVACPDHGAEARCKNVASLLGNQVETVTFVKQRDPDTGRIVKHDMPEDFDVQGRTALIIDDICDGGATFIGMAKRLKEAGARAVILWVTHGIFSRGIEPLIEAGIDYICTTNSRPEIDHSKLEVIPFRYDFATQKIVCETDDISSVQAA